MRIIVLSEAKAMDGFRSEHGLSFYIESGDKRVLFDTGASGLFLENANKLGLDLSRVDGVVLSHGHWDHGNGLPHLAGITRNQKLDLYTHPGVFDKRYRRPGSEYLGLSINRDEAGRLFELHCSREAIRLSEELYYLGEIPRIMDFEPKVSPYFLESGEADPIVDDSGLACVTSGGLVVVSGCAHSGIANMVEHARRITGVEKVAAVLGGFHLKHNNARTQSTLTYFRELRAEQVYPSHCTRGKAMELLHEAFRTPYLEAGKVVEF